jgi:hypothetical protein
MPSSVPLWLQRWKTMLQRLMEFIYNTMMTVVHYAAVSMRPNLKDRVLKLFFPVQVATTALTTVAALTVHRGSESYLQAPETCTHPQGLRNYGAAGKQIRICDVCGSRWIVNGKEMQKAQPKASPTAQTPLLSKASKAKAKAKATSSQSSPQTQEMGVGWPGFLRSSPPSSQHFSMATPPSRSRAAGATAKSAPSMARRMQEIYSKNAADLTEEEIRLLNHRYEDLQTFHAQTSEFDVENGEINAEDLLAQAGLSEEETWNSWAEEDAEMGDHGYV